MSAILALKVGDRVRNSRGGFGDVERFDRDRVHVRWLLDGHPIGSSYTDTELADNGVRKVSPFDAEDTIPG